MPPVIQVPPGVDTRRFVPLTREERNRARSALDVGVDDFLVSSYSRLVPRKGMDTLIRAAASLRGEFTNLRVSIGGAGRDRARLEELAAKLEAPVTLLGRIDDETLPAWLASSDLMVMDCRSRWLGLEQEGFGIVFLEAASCGVAQIAGRSGGSHEAVIDGVTGTVLANSRSVADLANAMRELIVDAPRRSGFAATARAVAEQSFDWERLSRHLARSLEPFDHFGVAKSRL